ncbi:uncharacterized protein LOC116848937 [Odontomachus brunneus]|uniref:uncharacterized protein LOC116848937 n=1 Tax=Odontomachus brunneus TaxID=486640 RepID=UPI0013F1B656|nr:uncharacterized protein LOC116848937 [Odontomachus brunneus]
MVAGDPPAYAEAGSPFTPRSKNTTAKKRLSGETDRGTSRVCPEFSSSISALSRRVPCALYISLACALYVIFSATIILSSSQHSLYGSERELAATRWIRWMPYRRIRFGPSKVGSKNCSSTRPILSS